MYTPSNIQVSPEALPSGPLGGMFAGMNASDTDYGNQANLMQAIQQVQREQQMLPSDVAIKQAQVAPAQYQAGLAQAKLNNPGYIPSVMSGEMAQNQLQQNAAEKSSALLPFQKKAEQFDLENQTANADLLKQFRDINDAITAGGGSDGAGGFKQFTPLELAAAKQRSASLLSQLKTTPEYAQKMDYNQAALEKALALKESDHQAQLANITARHQGEMEKQQAKLEFLMNAPPKSLGEGIVRDIRSRVVSGEITPDQGRVLMGQALAAQAKADATNTELKLEVGPDGNVHLNNTTPKNQQYTGQVPGGTGDVGKPVTVNNSAEWEKLAPGTKWVTPDGRQGTK